MWIVGALIVLGLAALGLPLIPLLRREIDWRRARREADRRRRVPTEDHAPWR